MLWRMDIAVTHKHVSLGKQVMLSTPLTPPVNTVAYPPAGCRVFEPSIQFSGVFDWILKVNKCLVDLRRIVWNTIPTDTNSL